MESGVASGDAGEDFIVERVPSTETRSALLQKAIRSHHFRFVSVVRNALSSTLGVGRGVGYIKKV